MIDGIRCCIDEHWSSLNFTVLKTDLKLLLTLFPDKLFRMNAATIFQSFIFNFGVAFMVNILHYYTHWTLSAPNP